MIPRKTKSETVFNTCVSFIKQRLKKMAEIPQKRDFLTWSFQNCLVLLRNSVNKPVE